MRTYAKGERSRNMSETSEFYTIKGYERAEKNAVTNAMEDYLEMICRLGESGAPVRVKNLAEALHVTPSAVTKMTGQLRDGGYLKNEKYGYLALTPEGERLGSFLLLRHDTVNRLLCFLNRTENELEETEKVEHALSPRTVENIRTFLGQVRFGK